MATSSSSATWRLTRPLQAMAKLAKNTNQTRAELFGLKSQDVRFEGIRKTSTFRSSLRNGSLLQVATHQDPGGADERDRE